MSLRHAVLGLLAYQPATGYELAQQFDTSLAYAWHARHSQIYPELAKLADAGLVEVVDEGARGSRTFAITGEGRAELERWLVDTEPSRAQRSETAVRWFLMFLLPPEQRRAVLEREIAYADRYRETLLGIERAVREAGDSQIKPTLDLGLRTSAVMRDWLREQLNALDG